MSGKYLLDTNIVIALFAADDLVQMHISAAREIFIPEPLSGSFFSDRLNPRTQKKIFLE